MGNCIPDVLYPDFITFTGVRLSQKRCGEHRGRSLAVLTYDIFP